MTCRELIEILDEYVDATMPAARVAELEQHLAGCEACRAYLATYRATRRLGAAAARVEVPEEMKARLRAFLAARLGAS
jgi:anti-sigma factor RsiW